MSRSQCCDEGINVVSPSRSFGLLWQIRWGKRCMSITQFLIMLHSWWRTHKCSHHNRAIPFPAAQQSTDARKLLQTQAYTSSPLTLSLFHSRD